MEYIYKINNKVLETNRLILRSWKIEDLSDFYEYAKVEGVGEMAGWKHHESIEESKDILKMFIENDITFAVVLKDNNKVIGSIGIEDSRLNTDDLSLLKGKEIGYVLSKEYWGKGLMAEAVNKVIEYLFDEHKLDFLLCAYFISNNQSARVQEKCGFTYYTNEIFNTRIGTKEKTIYNIRYNKNIINYKMDLIDLHCDTISRLFIQEKENKDSNLRSNHLDVDLDKMHKGHYLLQTFAIFTALKSSETPEKDCLLMIDKYYRELEINKDLIKPVFKASDIDDNMKNNKMSALLSLEEGDVVFKDLGMLRNYYRLGVRMICLTWNYPSNIAYPNFLFDKNIDRYNMLRQININDGLTPFGVEYIKEMERLGIIIDVSHLSDKGFLDVYNNTSKPFIASHSNARTICDVSRNLTDDMIIKLASRGGIIGINYCEDFLSNDGNGRIESIIKQINHIVKIGGIDCVSLGSDFDGIKKRKDLDDASKMNDLRIALVKEGYSKENIEKIFYKNALRLFKEILK